MKKHVVLKQSKMDSVSSYARKMLSILIWIECLWSFLQKRPNHPVCLHRNSRRRLFPPDQVNSTISWLLIDNTLPPIKITSQMMSMSPPSNFGLDVGVCLLVVWMSLSSPSSSSLPFVIVLRPSIHPFVGPFFPRIDDFQCHCQL